MLRGAFDCTAALSTPVRPRCAVCSTCALWWRARAATAAAAAAATAREHIVSFETGAFADRSAPASARAALDAARTDTEMAAAGAAAELAAEVDRGIADAAAIAAA